VTQKDIEYTREEALVELVLRRDLQELSRSYPPPSSWDARANGQLARRMLPPMHKAPRLAVAVVALALVIVGGSLALQSGWVMRTQPGSTLAYKQFDNGDFAYEFPSSWNTLSSGFQFGSVRVYSVLGTGEWHTGCFISSAGAGCNPDKVDVSEGRVVVTIYSRVDGPGQSCGIGEQANATIGPNAVIQTTSGATTTWEIRRPGQEFGWMNNVFVDVTAGSSNGIEEAVALVSSFRWMGQTTNRPVCAPASA
jgi:hypothetical protein